LAALLSLVNYRIGQGLAPPEAAAAVARALGDEGGEASLEPLLANRKLLILGKASDLAGSYERVLQNYRLITELRPVFSEAVDEAPDTALITHQLEVSAIRNGRLDVTTFALSSEDLEQLQLQLQRAQAKERQLKIMADKAGLAVIDQRDFFG